MATSFLPVQLDRFRREAKKLSRELSIPHSEALDRIAVENGYLNWSLLAKHSKGAHLLESVVQAPLPRPPRGTRYYLHGDIRETNLAQCYCARCDTFEPIGHLVPTSYHADGKDGERYLRDLKRWNERQLEEDSQWFRPATAQNVLAAAAVAERDAREAARSPFHRWLDGQRERNDPVGDLAGDILRDAGFPINMANRRELEDHLSQHGSRAVKAFRQAWHEFSGGERHEWTLADALAAELKITREEAQELVDVEPMELTGQSGDGAYGYEFDFTDHASPRLAAKLLRKRRSLKVQVGPWFFDGIRHSEFPR
ncbi:YozE family protein [Roseateles chitinivorans]|uniref:YozE family protein n=1 Tax=Roseateles chitinivorans TaxID=2917965 RepID=UPI003D67E022